MSWDAGSITGALDWDISSFARGQLEAEGLARLFPSIVTDFLANPMLGWAAVAAAAGAAVIGTMRGVADFVEEAFKKSLETADNLNDLAINASVPVQLLSGIGLAAENAGSNVQGVAEMFKFLGKNAVEAQEGAGKLTAAIAKDMKEAQEAFAKGDFAEGTKKMQEAQQEQLQGVAATFKQLGVEVVDASGKIRPLEDLFFELSDALAKMPPGAERTHVAMELLGRSGSEMISFLSQGAGVIKDQIALYDKMGATVTKANATSADAFNDLWHDVGTAWTGIQNTVGVPIRDALLPYLQELQGWVASNAPAIQSQVRDAVAAAIGVGENAVGWLRTNWPEIRAQLGETGNDLRSVFEIVESGWPGMRLTLEAALQLLKEVVAEINTLKEIASWANDPIGSAAKLINNTVSTPGFLPGSTSGPNAGGASIGPNTFNVTPNTPSTSIIRQLQDKFEESQRRYEQWTTGGLRDAVGGGL